MPDNSTHYKENREEKRDRSLGTRVIRYRIWTETWGSLCCLGRSILGRRKSKCKDPETGTYLMYSRSSRKATVVGEYMCKHLIIQRYKPNFIEIMGAVWHRKKSVALKPTGLEVIPKLFLALCAWTSCLTYMILSFLIYKVVKMSYFAVVL